MTKNKLIKLIAPALLSLSLSYAAIQPEAPVTMPLPETPMTVVTEYHVIESIDNGQVSGENVNGKGEGIVYSLSELMYVNREHDSLKVGDVIAVSWSYDNYMADEWDSLHSVEIVE